MAEFQKVMGARARMCGCLTCSICPLSLMNNGHNEVCDVFIREAPERAEELIMQWSAEHPIMTNSKKFEEVFGKDLFKLCTKEPWSDVVKWIEEEYKGGK